VSEKLRDRRETGMRVRKTKRSAGKKRYRKYVIEVEGPRNRQDIRQPDGHIRGIIKT
jgi:hypothetical protein